MLNDLSVFGIELSLRRSQPLQWNLMIRVWHIMVSAHSFALYAVVSFVTRVSDSLQVYGVTIRYIYILWMEPSFVGHNIETIYVSQPAATNPEKTVHSYVDKFNRA